MAVARDEFEGFIAEVESFKDTIIEEFAKLKTEIEKLKYDIEEINDVLKCSKGNSDIKLN